MRRAVPETGAAAFRARGPGGSVLRPGSPNAGLRVTSVHLWLKALHIVAFAAWMAGMWYLPRLFVYHADTRPGSEASELFKVMERRLLFAITLPAAVATWLFGLALATSGALWGEGWLHAKLLLLVALTAVLVWLARERVRFARDERPRPARIYRMVNEIPTLLFFGIVLLAVLRPF